MMLRLYRRSLLIAPVMLLAAYRPVAGQSLIFLNSEPRVQLTGEDFQIRTSGVNFSDKVPGRTLSRAGVHGADLGFPVTYPDKILFLFGDTMGGFLDNERFFFAGTLGADGMGYIPNTDLSQCHYIANVDSQISQGNPNPSVSQAECPAMEFFLNPNRGPREHAFQRIVINGLEPGDGIGTFRTPSGAIEYNNRLYMFFKVQIQMAEPHLALKTILVKADQDSSTLWQSNPPTFTRLYTVSSISPVPDPSNPPVETDNVGKFIFNPPVVMDQATLRANAISPGLPEALQNAERVVLVFGSSYRYNRSNLYLAAFNLSDIERGTSAWFYFAGRNGGVTSWTNDERKAAPLLNGEPRIGNHSVIWNQALRRFVLMWGNIAASASATPWGPWSDPVSVFPANGDWANKLVHRVAGDGIKRTVTPIYDSATGDQTDLNSHEIGIPYGPNLLDQATVNPDNSVTLYYSMSTWNPYQVFLTSSTFRIGPRPASVVSAASFDGTAVAPGSIATILGSGLSAEEVSAPSGGSLPDALGGVSVLVQDSQGVSRRAGLYYVSPDQISFVVPDETARGPANINVMAGTSLVSPAIAAVAPTAPSIFSANSNGTGPAAAIVVTADANRNLTSRLTFSCSGGAGSCVNTPIDLSDRPGASVVELYGTGIRGRNRLESVSATIGGVPAKVQFAGPQPQYPGLDQVNIELSPELRGRGEVDLILLVNGRPVNTVKLAVQ